MLHEDDLASTPRAGTAQHHEVAVRKHVVADPNRRSDHTRPHPPVRGSPRVRACPVSACRRPPTPEPTSTCARPTAHSQRRGSSRRGSRPGPLRRRRTRGSARRWGSRGRHLRSLLLVDDVGQPPAVRRELRTVFGSRGARERPCHRFLAECQQPDTAPTALLAREGEHRAVGRK